MAGACYPTRSWPIGPQPRFSGSVPQMTGPGGWREVVTFRFGDHGDSGRIRGRIDLGLESRVRIDLEQKGLELGFRHGGSWMGHSSPNQAGEKR